MRVDEAERGTRIRRWTAAEMDASRWDEWIEASPHGSVFHRYWFLRTMAEHSPATLHGLVGYLDGTPIGAFPVFELSKGPFSGVFSPPPRLGVPTLGPILFREAQRSPFDRTEIARRFLRQCHRWLGSELDPSYLRLHVDAGFGDFDAFSIHDGCSVTPQFTYVVDLSPGPDDLLASFSRDARNNVRSADETRYEVSVGGREAIERIVRELNRRYDEQGLAFSPSTSFVTDLYDRLSAGTVRPYVLCVDGDFASGMIVLEEEGTIYRWLGGAKPETDLPANDLLDWHIMRDGIDRGKTRYDLVGANVSRLCEYKSKFNPDLVAHQLVERDTFGANVVTWAYQRARKAGVAPLLR